MFLKARHLPVGAFAFHIITAKTNIAANRHIVAQRALLLSFCTPLLCCKMDWLALFTLLQSAFGLAHLLVHRCPCHCLQKQLQVNNQSVWCDIRLSCKSVILLLLNSLLPSKSTTDYQNAISVVYNVMSLVKHILVWTISGCIGSL